MKLVKCKRNDLIEYQIELQTHNIQTDNFWTELQMELWTHKQRENLSLEIPIRFCGNIFIVSNLNKGF